MPSPIYQGLNEQDRERYIADRKRSDAAARKAADEALRKADPDTSSDYERYARSHGRTAAILVNDRAAEYGALTDGARRCDGATAPGRTE